MTRKQVLQRALLLIDEAENASEQATRFYIKSRTEGSGYDLHVKWRKERVRLLTELRRLLRAEMLKTSR